MKKFIKVKVNKSNNIFFISKIFQKIDFFLVLILNPLFILKTMNFLINNSR